MSEYLWFDAVTKDYGPTRALAEVSFSIVRGEIHGLVGENGAGKSTIAKLIAGDIRPTAGEICLNGAPIVEHSAARARECGIAIIHQWGDLAPDLTVVDNIFLGNEVRYPWGGLNKAEMVERASRVLGDFGITLDLSIAVGRLSAGVRQIVSIAKALCQEKTELLIVDEGGASLDREEVEILSRVLRKLRESGVTVLYISHILNNVIDLCDRITVVRNGHFIDTVPSRGMTVGRLGALVVGHELRETSSTPAGEGSARRRIRLEIDGLQWEGNNERYSFQLEEGQVLGITGPAGAGKSELLRTIMGLMPKSSGRIVIDGHDIPSPTPERMVRSGIAFVPEDRLAEGLAVNRSIEENISFPTLWKRGRFFLDLGALKEKATRAGEVVRLKYGSIGDPVASLSGGNQQKTSVAKWIDSSYELFLLDEPYKGIDIGAKEDINDVIRVLAREGKTIVVVSTEFSDLTGFVDRLIVMVNRRFVADLAGTDINSQTIIGHYQTVIK